MLKARSLRLLLEIGYAKVKVVISDGRESFSWMY